MVLVRRGFEQGVVGIDNQREVHALPTCFVADVLVQVGGEVDVGPGLVQQGNEFGGNVQFAVPASEGGAYGKR